MKLSGTLFAAQGLPLFATLLCAHNKRSFEKLICQVHVSQLPQDRLLEVRETETLVVSILRRIYSPIVEFAVPHRILALAATGLLFALALFARPVTGPRIPAAPGGGQSLDSRNHAPFVGCGKRRIRVPFGRQAVIFSCHRGSMVRSRGHRARSGASQPAIGVCSGSLSAIGFCWKRAGAIPS
jgi:hypothetical protein